MKAVLLKSCLAWAGDTEAKDAVAYIDSHSEENQAWHTLQINDMRGGLILTMWEVIEILTELILPVLNKDQWHELTETILELREEMDDGTEK